MPSKPTLSNQEKVMAFIKAVAGQSNVIVVPHIFLQITGDLMLAAMLAQLVYWSDRSVRPDGLVYKSAQNWKDEVGARRYAVDSFKKLPYVHCVIKKANGNPTSHYSIDFDLLFETITQFQQKEAQKASRGNARKEPVICSDFLIEPPPQAVPSVAGDKSITDLTTENTTERINPEGTAPVGLSPEPEPPPRSISNSKKQTKPKEPADPVQFPMMEAIAKVTGYDLKVRDTRSRIGKIASQLLKAGYTPADVINFETYWKENDWRWKQSHLPPRPSDVHSMIHLSRSTKNTTVPTFEEKRAAALKEIEDFKKQQESNHGTLQS